MLGIIFLTLRILAAAALFLFLGWALRLIWMDLKRQAVGEADQKIPGLTLTPVENPELESYQTSQSPLTVGRDPACGLHLQDKTISSRHAQLTYQMGQWWVEDLQSMNGTDLNNQVVSGPVVLTSGDELRFGQILFQVEKAETLVPVPEASSAF